MCVALQCRGDDRWISIRERESPHVQLWVAVGLGACIVHHLILVKVRGSTHRRVAVVVWGLVRYRLIHHRVVKWHHILRSIWVGVEIGPRLGKVTRRGPRVEKHICLSARRRPVMLGECIVITELIVSAVAVVELTAERPIGLIVRSGLFEILRDLGWRK